MNFDNFKKDINHFVSILFKKAKDSLEDLILFFSNNFGESNELFIYILNINNDINSTIKEKIINYFTNYNNNLEKIIYFIEHLEKKEDVIIRLFYENINKLSLKVNDFYSKKETNNFKLFKNLISHKKDFIINLKSDYLDNTNNICKDLLKNFRELNIVYNDINKKDNLISDKKFIERIKLLFLFTENEDDINNKYEKESNDYSFKSYRKIQCEKMLS